jgi:hypothetical protein
MRSIYSVLIAATVLIAVPYALAAEGAEMKTVPFWWSTDPLTGEQVYTDYFKESSGVQREHNAYLAQTASDLGVSTINPSILLEGERSNMVEVITYELKHIRAGDSAFYQGPFSNPDYIISERVAVSTWVKAPIVVELEVTEDVTPDVTPIVTDVTPDVTPIVPVIEVLEVAEEPKRTTNNKGNTHWDVNDADHSGSNEMTQQEFKDMKKKHAYWKAYETASKLYPSLYPAYVHDYTHHEVAVVEEEPLVVVVPIEVKPEVIINESPLEQFVPSVTSNEVVVPIPEPVAVVPVTPRVTSSEVVPETIIQPVIPNATSIVPSIIVNEDFVMPELPVLPGSITPVVPVPGPLE